MNRLLLCGALLGTMSVVMGTLGNHLLTLTPDQAGSLEAAIRYNMVYAVLIVALSMAPDNKYLFPGTVFTLGASIFCLSIYASLITGVQSLTYLTPIGGVTILGAWVSIALFAIKRQ